MGAPFVKVCCIADLDEARLAVGAGASAIGLVSAMPSGPGSIPEEAIAAIAAAVPQPTETFLLTCLVDVREAFDHVLPAGLDVCSGLRLNGRLDAGRLRGFFDALH